jgi:hypothetical protein
VTQEPPKYLRLESADDTKLELNRRGTNISRVDGQKPNFVKHNVPVKQNDSHCDFHHEKIIINVEGDGNSEFIHKNLITNNNTHIMLEDGREEDQANLMKIMKSSKIINSIKASDTEEGFPVLNLEKDRKANRRKSGNFQNLRLVSNKSLTLCSDICSNITLDKFNTIIDNYAKIKICKVSLEKITMPQFRDVKMNDEKKEETVSRKDQNDNGTSAPVVNNNRTIIIFVSCLILMFAGLVTFILLK